MKTFVNDIELDYSTYVPRKTSFQVTDTPVQNSGYENIVNHVRKNTEEFSLECAFNSEDREEKFNRLVALSEKRELVQVQQNRLIENLIITSITEPSDYENVISFSISFRQVSVQNFEITTTPLPDSLQQLQAKTFEGLQTTEEVQIAEATYPQRIGGPLDY